LDGTFGPHEFDETCQASRGSAATWTPEDGSRQRGSATGRLPGREQKQAGYAPPGALLQAGKADYLSGSVVGQALRALTGAL
jgi:hypothetical protein